MSMDWIPVSKKRPPLWKDVLLSIDGLCQPVIGCFRDDGKEQGIMHQDIYEKYWDNSSRYCVKYWFKYYDGACDEHAFLDEVSAWMPLPEPYERRQKNAR